MEVYDRFDHVTYNADPYVLKEHLFVPIMVAVLVQPVTICEFTDITVDMKKMGVWYRVNVLLPLVSNVPSKI